MSEAAWRPKYNPWLVAMTVTLATFMEVLDTSIANVAVPHIAGGLAVSAEEATWVLTSYLVSNAIVLPISAWIASRVGRKRFYMTCVLLFTVSSVLCGFAPNLPTLVLFRVLQGIGGGGLAPSEQGILADTFAPEKRGMAFAMYGFAVVFAPAIGPTLGGFIVDHASWRWIFFINVPVGIASLFLTSLIVEDPPWLQKEKAESKGRRVDVLGLALVSLAFGSLQVVFDKGQEKDWFGSPAIVVFALTAGICLVSAIIWEWMHPDPIVNLRLFANRNFATSALLMFTLGAVLYGSTVLLPLFLQSLMGYTAQLAGEALSAGGLTTMAMMPLVGFLVSRVPAKFLIAAGFCGLSLSLWHMMSLNLEIDFRTAMMFRVYQASSLAFLFVPISTVSYIGIEKEQNNQVSGLMNLARNIGGSAGIAYLTTMLARRSQTYHRDLVDNLQRSNPFFEDRLSALRQQFLHLGPADAPARALGAVDLALERQAALLSYVHIVSVLAVVTACLVPVILLILKRNTPGQQPAGAH